jgi:hypothetical protein
MRQTALLSLRMKACCGFFRPKYPTDLAGFELAILGTRGHFLAGVEKQRHERDGRILLGDNTSGGAVVLRPIRLYFVVVLISTGLSFVRLAMRAISSYICKIRRVPHLPELSRYVSPC